MRKTTLAIVTLAALALPREAPATDLPYGGDALPYIAHEASDIVRSAEPHSADIDKPKGVSVYTVTVRAVLKGNEKLKDDSILVVFPRHLDIQSPDSLQQALLFLHGPLSDQEARDWDLPGKPAIYLAVSGRFGVIRKQDLQRQDAVVEYIGQIESKDPYWSKKYVESKDLFLQRSAILDLGQRVQAPSDFDVEQPLALLERALQSDAVIAANKFLAIHGLEDSNKEHATNILQHFSESQDNAAELRKSAVQAIANLPGGPKLLAAWADGEDKMLAPTAREVLSAIRPQGTMRKVTDELKRDLRDRLKSRDPSVRAGAVSDIRNYAPDTELTGALTNLASGDNEATSLKLYAIETMSRFNTKDAAEDLAKVGIDTHQPALVRKAAILAISKMDDSIKRPVLKRLASQLEESPVKDLATELVPDDK